MKMKLLIISAAMISAVAGTAVAQGGTVTGAAGGAVTGAIVGGPVGAAVGGVIGAIAGTAVAPPPAPVITYVRQQPMPVETVVVEQRVAVGQPIPKQVVLMPIPENPTYAYAVINNQRVIVDPQTYVVVGVVE